MTTDLEGHCPIVTSLVYEQRYPDIQKPCALGVVVGLGVPLVEQPRRIGPINQQARTVNQKVHGVAAEQLSAGLMEVYIKEASHSLRHRQHFLDFVQSALMGRLHVLDSPHPTLWPAAPKHCRAFGELLHIETLDSYLDHVEVVFLEEILGYDKAVFFKVHAVFSRSHQLRLSKPVSRPQTNP